MILRRYVATNLVRAWLMVLLVVGAVFGLIAFITELERTTADYTALAAARYTLLTLPQQLVGLAPVIALLGSIMALANLARHNELTVISCAGVSLKNLLAAIALPTLVLMGLLWASLEFATPRLHQHAEQQRHYLRHGGDVRIPDGGVWSRNERRYVHMSRLDENGVPGGIDLYEFNDDGTLVRTLHAVSAEVLSGRRWLLKQVREKRLVDDVFQTRGYRELEVDGMWAQDELPSLSLTADSMTLSVLYRYSQFLKENGQSWQSYLGAFWQKLAMPFTVGAMVLLATPIAAGLGSRRNSNFGVSLGIGALIGILFYLGAQIIYALGQLLSLSVPAVALFPTCIVFAAALLLLRRMHW